MHRLPAHQPSVEHGSASAKSQPPGELLLGRGHACADAVIHDGPYFCQLHVTCEIDIVHGLGRQYLLADLIM